MTLSSHLFVLPALDVIPECVRPHCASQPRQMFSHG